MFYFLKAYKDKANEIFKKYLELSEKGFPKLKNEFFNAKITPFSHFIKDNYQSVAAQSLGLIQI